MIIGTGGRLGAALVREFEGEYALTGFNHAQLDLSNLDAVREKLRAMSFDVLINAAAFTNVDLCETERDRAFLINAEAPGVLAELCDAKHAKLIHFSTDYVFDGEKRAPYTEHDEPNPISVYGESKLAGEKNVLAAGDRPASRPEDSRLIQPAGSPSSFDSRSSTLDVPSVEGAARRRRVRRHLVVRVSWLFGPDRPSFIDAMIKRAQENENLDAIADKISTPTYTHDIARMLPRFFTGAPVAGIGDPGKNLQGAGFAIEAPTATEAGVNAPGYSPSDYGGILHFANAGKCSWQEYAQWALDCGHDAGVLLKARTVGALKLNDMKNWVARRPAYSVLSTEKYTELTGTPPRAWREAVADYITHFYSKK